MRRLLVPLAVAVLALAGCSADVSDGSSFELTEFTITGPDTILVGANPVAISNSGEFPHTLVVTDSTGQVVAATGLIAPGTTTAIDLDLGAGRYNLTCRIVAENDEGDLVDHFEAGMHASLTVAG